MLRIHPSEAIICTWIRETESLLAFPKDLLELTTSFCFMGLITTASKTLDVFWDKEDSTHQIVELKTLGTWLKEPGYFDKDKTPKTAGMWYAGFGNY